MIARKGTDADNKHKEIRMLDSLTPDPRTHEMLEWRSSTDSNEERVRHKLHAEPHKQSRRALWSQQRINEKLRVV